MGNQGGAKGGAQEGAQGGIKGEPRGKLWVFELLPLLAETSYLYVVNLPLFRVWAPPPPPKMSSPSPRKIVAKPLAEFIFWLKFDPKKVSNLVLWIHRCCFLHEPLGHKFVLRFQLFVRKLQQLLLNERNRRLKNVFIRKLQHLQQLLLKLSFNCFWTTTSIILNEKLQ